MMLPDFSTRPPLVFHHDDADGFCSAMVIRSVNPGARLVAVDYGVDFALDSYGDLSKTDVVLVDFVPDDHVLVREIARRAGTLSVIDHHVTSRWTEALADEFPTVYTSFAPDKHISAAQHAYDVLLDDLRNPGPSVNMEWLVNYVSDMDTWTKALNNTEHVSVYLASFERTPEAWDTVIAGGLDEAINTGHSILRFADQQIAEILATQHTVELYGHTVPAVNNVLHRSQVCGELAKSAPFAAAYWRDGDLMRASLRSARQADGTQVNVAKICEEFGGGGHPAAAGFVAGLGEKYFTLPFDRAPEFMFVPKFADGLPLM